MGHLWIARVGCRQLEADEGLDAVGRTEAGLRGIRGG